jgi:hypothetical protein
LLTCINSEHGCIKNERFHSGSITVWQGVSSGGHFF